MAIEPVWEPAGAALLIDVTDSGQHQLELGMRLTQTANGRMTGFDLIIPPVATSRLELSVPADAGEIEIPTAHGAIVRDNAKDQLTAALGATERLTVRWADSPARAGVPTQCEVDELVWLRLQPGSILLDAKFKYRVLSGKVEQLTLTADPRLRLLPPGEGDNQVGDVRILAGDPQTIVYELAKPVADEVTIEARFLLTGTSSIGNLRLPRLEPLTVRSKSRSLAVSIDPALEWDETKGDGVSPLAVPEFLTAWGGGEPKPVVAHRLRMAMWRGRCRRSRVNQCSPRDKLSHWTCGVVGRKLLPRSRPPPLTDIAINIACSCPPRCKSKASRFTKRRPSARRGGRTTTTGR